MNRRNLLKSVAMGAAALLVRPAFSLGLPQQSDAAARLAALERRHGGRLGVAVLDTGNGRYIGHRADERFAMCSTFKILAAAAVLSRVDRRLEQLDRRVAFGKDALVAHSPITSHHVGAPGMTMAELCHAAITMSDNTAGNLLLHSLDGPVGLTAYARSMGDEVSRLDRIETGLNEARPGDPRDTTTPAAMLANLQTLLLGTALSGTSREQLAAWLCANTTGAARLRAGLPSGWRVGDKTGSGDHAATNDIAIIWPPQRKPLLVAAYYTESAADAAQRNAVLAEVGRIAASS